MIRVTKPKRHAVCNSCGSIEKIKKISVSLIGDGWTSIMLCDSCALELIEKLKEVSN